MSDEVQRRNNETLVAAIRDLRQRADQAEARMLHMERLIATQEGLIRSMTEAFATSIPRGSGPT